MSSENLLNQPISISALEDILSSFYAKEASLDEMRESGYEAEDNSFSEREAYGNISLLRMKACLTERQQQIWCLIKQGKTRKEIASYIMVSEQAVHQIIPRIRKRLRKYGN
jgi:DNA-binding NarL/FixJ family response regulator